MNRVVPGVPRCTRIGLTTPRWEVEFVLNNMKQGVFLEYLSRFLKGQSGGEVFWSLDFLGLQQIIVRTALSSLIRPIWQDVWVGSGRSDEIRPISEQVKCCALLLRDLCTFFKGYRRWNMGVYHDRSFGWNWGGQGKAWPAVGIAHRRLDEYLARDLPPFTNSDGNDQLLLSFSVIELKKTA